jgi:hypothetical protein
MFEGSDYSAHLAHWGRALNRRPMTWLDRAFVRWSLARRYRALGLPRPAGVFLDSPFAAAIAAGVASGVRWLQRHPELIPSVFGARFDRAQLAHSIRLTVEEVAKTFAPRLEPAPIIAAIAAATATPPAWLPDFARVAARSIETLDAAPTLAVNEGRIETRLLVEPLQRVRDGLLAVAMPEMLPQFTAVVPQAVDEAFGRVRCPDTFFGRVLAASFSAVTPSASLVSTAVVAAFAPRRWRGRETRDVLRIVHGAGRVFTHADFWIASNRPATVATDLDGRLHYVDGAAVAWRDGAGLGFLHGVHIDLALLSRPLTLTEILNTENAEVRRRLIELYERGDPGRFIRDADADVLEFDFDRLGNRRRLLRFALWGDEPYVAVEVTNSTPEPDGSQKYYILRVPPTMRSCREAVAWTFGLTSNEYDPEIET